PIIDEVSPDPDSAWVGVPYVRQLTLTQGTAPVTWILLQGPAGASVDSSGLVSGWTPLPSQLGSDVSFEVQASNVAGSDTEAWQVHVPPAPPAFIEQAGQVVLEAENYDLKTDGSGSVNDTWVRQSDNGAVGDYMESLPDDGTNVNSQIETTSPLLGFTVQFTQTGTYYLWLRGWGPDGAGDSVHYGLDGTSISYDFDSAAVIERVGAFAWRSNTGDGGRPTIQIASAGLHQIDIWMREDGSRIDRILLTTDANYTPTGTGPAESPHPAPLPGDLDLDGDVDLDDFSILAGAMNGPGQSPGNPTADIDGDGDCDLADFQLLAGSFTGAF
ncbi:MAG: dockerin type I domain-containing protein, partial [Phycisphaerae bacterium]